MAPHEIPVKRLRWPGFRDLASISFVKLRSDCKIKKRRPILGSWKYEHSISVTRTNFFQVCVRLPWKKASSAPLGTETGKGNHNFSNVVRALHLTLKWRENYLFPIYLFQLAVGRSCRIQNSFYLETKHRGPIIFPPCGHVIFSISCLKQPMATYENISRFTDYRKPYILLLSIGLRQIDPFDRQNKVIILRSLSRSQCRWRNCY